MKKIIITAVVVVAGLLAAACGSSQHVTAQTYISWQNHGGRAEASKLINDITRAGNGTGPAVRAAGRQMVADAAKAESNPPPGRAAVPFKRAMEDYKVLGLDLEAGNVRAAARELNQAITDEGAVVKIRRGLRFSSAAPAAPAAPTPAPMSTPVGQAPINNLRQVSPGVYANQNTSDAFASKVVSAYDGSPDQQVYSPVTGQTYTITYTGQGNGTVIATGGNGVYVEFHS